MIVETQDREKARQDHKNLIEDFEKLKSNPGWLRLKEYLDAEASQVFHVLTTSKEGDTLIKASGAYTTLKNIASLPQRETEASIQRLNQMIEEDKQDAKFKSTLRTNRNQP